MDPLKLWHELSDADKVAVDVIATNAIAAIHARSRDLALGKQLATDAAFALIRTALNYQMSSEVNAPTTETPQ